MVSHELTSKLCTRPVCCTLHRKRWRGYIGLLVRNSVIVPWILNYTWYKGPVALTSSANMRILPSFASASFSSCAPGYAIPALRPDMCSCWKRYASHSSTNSATASNTRRNTRRSLNSGEDNSATPLTLEHVRIFFYTVDG